MPKTLLIVESPNKAKTMRHYVDASFTIEASFGHICDMPKEYGVDLSTFEEAYEVREDRAKQRIANLRKLAKEHDQVIIATDPDREGEGIAWHLCRELRLDVRKTGRIMLHEINKTALASALQKPGSISVERVDAQRARRVLDRIVGYDVSGEICQPANARSAGRVQTPALHILCELERKILSFVPKKYWTISADYKEGFSAYVAAADEGSAESEGDEFTRDDTSGKDSDGRLKKRTFESQAEAQGILAEIQANPHVVQDLATEQVSKSPPVPYDTAECMSDAGRKLKLGTKQVAQLLQSLFEAGYITYHRTDSTRVSPEAVKMAQDYIQQVAPQALGSGAGNAGKGGAQDAHEAIRPSKLTGDESPPAGTAELYAMIKARFLASQSKPALFERTRITVKSGSVELLADGSVLLDAGYLVFWGPYAKQEDEILPKVAARQQLDVEKCEAKEKKTTPPSRLDSAGLTKKLKSSGLGRPSTYANIIETLLARGYAENVAVGKKQVMKPTDLGMRVDEMLTECFPEIVSEEYTADMEGKLEEIEAGKMTRVDYLRDWHADFREKMGQALQVSAEYRKRHNIVARAPGQSMGEDTGTTCDRCGESNYLKIPRKQGGHFLACPKCRMTRDLKAKVKKAGCKKCGSALIEKTSADKRSFFSCVRYGAETDPCDYVESEGKYLKEDTGATCPTCGRHNIFLLTPRNPKDGSPFKVCGDPERDRAKRCPYIESQGKYAKSDTGQKCPLCGRHNVFLLSPRDPKDGSPFKVCGDPERDRAKRCKFIEGEGGGKYAKADTGEKCPVCRKYNVFVLTPRDPKDGSPFKVCGDPERDKAKRCKFIESDGGGKYVKSDAGQKCPVCRKHNLVVLTPRNAKDGSPFKACADPSRSCRFIMDAEAELCSEPCPDCGKPVVEKFRKPTDEERKKKQKGKSFWACTGYPSCRHARDKETAKK